MVKPQGLLRLEFDGRVSSDVGSIGTDPEQDFESLNSDDESGSNSETHGFLSLMSAEAKDGKLVEDNLADLGDVHASIEMLKGATWGGSGPSGTIDLAPLGYSQGDVTTDSHRGFVSSKDYGHSFCAGANSLTDNNYRT